MFTDPNEQPSSDVAEAIRDLTEVMEAHREGKNPAPVVNVHVPQQPAPVVNVAKDEKPMEMTMQITPIRNAQGLVQRYDVKCSHA